MSLQLQPLVWFIMPELEVLLAVWLSVVLEKRKSHFPELQEERDIVSAYIVSEKTHGVNR